MQKTLSMILALVLTACFAAVQAEEPDNWLASDWQMVCTIGDTTVAEQTVFIYDDNTFEMTADGTDSESIRGTLTFDGETLTLSRGGEDLVLKADETRHELSGEAGGVTIVLRMAIEPEAGGLTDDPQDETAETPTAGGMLSGGWTIAEDPAITPEIESLLWNALDSYQTGTVTVAYTPAAYLGSQVAAGTNHAVLCRASEINKGAQWVIVYLYEDLEGNVSVLDIADVALGI